MKRKRELTGIRVKSFVTQVISRDEMKTIDGGEHPTCPTDGGPATDVPLLCGDFETRPVEGCYMIA